jgi:hypothetical protein
MGAKQMKCKSEAIRLYKNNVTKAAAGYFIILLTDYKISLGCSYLKKTNPH